MSVRWANHGNAETGDIFHALHAGLTVELISTKRPQLKTCALPETLAVVMAENTEAYDFLPVIGPGDCEEDQIVGLFNAAKFFDETPGEGCIEEYYAPLCEEYLIGADASILDFVKGADEKPCRLVISGASIVGLVSLSDLQKLPVRAVLFALITGLEISMFEVIKKECPNDDDWKHHLIPGRRRKIDEEIGPSHPSEIFVDALLSTQFCDKADILQRITQLPESKTAIKKKLDRIEELRNKLAHANEYAESREQARDLCAVVRDLLTLREFLRAS